MSNILLSGEEIKVKLIGSMPRESYVDIAGTITRSEDELEEIISMPYNASIVRNIVDMGHLATTEFDYFVFAVEGLSRVSEVQLVRKRMASYMIKSGRVNKKGKRTFDVIKPKSIKDFYAPVEIDPSKILVNDSENLDSVLGHGQKLQIDLTYDDIINIIESWYNTGVANDYPEEDLRFIKPQGTEWKGLIAMNGHALLDWFKIRCCQNAQHEIRILANKMLELCKEHSPALFENAGPSCKVLGYCPENARQNDKCKGKVLTHKDVLKIIKSKS